jgi:hypothetical protein
MRLSAPIKTYTIQITQVEGVEGYSAEVKSIFLAGRLDHRSNICAGTFETLNAALRFSCEQILFKERDIPDDGDEPFDSGADVVESGFLPSGPVVYFLQAQTGGPIKIGWSSDIKQRLDALQPGCPYPLNVLLCVRGSFADEQLLHQKFARFRLHGEWFEAAEEVLKYILSVRSKRCFQGQPPPEITPFPLRSPPEPA